MYMHVVYMYMHALLTWITFKMFTLASNEINAPSCMYTADLYQKWQ